MNMNMNVFSDIIGHVEIVEALQRAIINKRVAHAYLFSGAEGIGKYKTAWAFARMLQCTCNGTGECLACHLADGQTHPDIMTITPQGTAIRIEQIRDIQKDVQYNPRIGNRKIFILDGVERLTVQAANSILKLLEEPPAFVVFMLLTANIHSVLPTLLSRCQHLMFHTVPAADIVKYLAKQGVNPEQAAVVAAVSGGIPGRALLWAESGNIHRDQVMNHLENLQMSSHGQIWDVVTALDQEREQILITFELISFVLRDCLVWKATGDKEYLLYKDVAERVASLAEKATLDGLLNMYKELDTSRQMLLGNANTRLLLEKLCLKMQDALAIRGGNY